MNDLVSIDIIGHEFGHAVDDYAADLLYQGERCWMNPFLTYTEPLLNMNIKMVIG